MAPPAHLRRTDPVRHFHGRFRALGTAERAEGARAYMKSQLSFHGVTMPQIRAECVAFSNARAGLDRKELRAMVDALYATEGFDLRTAAIALLERHVGELGVGDVAWLIRLVRASPCWAHVDYLATQVIDPLVQENPALLAKARSWARHDDFWVRRVSLLAQLTHLRAGAGDFALFAEIAEPMLDEKEFFIRKAIGWVLREVSKKRPELVRDFVVAHAPRVSSVTWNEATKYLPPPMKKQVTRARSGQPKAGRGAAAGK